MGTVCFQLEACGRVSAAVGRNNPEERDYSERVREKAYGSLKLDHFLAAVVQLLKRAGHFNDQALRLSDALVLVGVEGNSQQTSDRHFLRRV